MPITHTSRTGKRYYLHTGPKRGGGTQYFLSTKPTEPLADKVPDGFEIHETVNGQVYLRRRPPELIRAEEQEFLQRRLPPSKGGTRYQIEVSGESVILHESASDSRVFTELASHLSVQEQERISERFAHYQPIMRFILTDAERRFFAPERYCFRGSVDDWISIGSPAQLKTVVTRYFKHLGKDSFYELY